MSTVGPDQRQIAQIVEQEHARPQPVVEVVADIGDVVGERCDLRLGARPGLQLQVVIGRIGRDIGRRAIADQRPVVLDHALQRLPGQVQAVEAGVAALEVGDHAQGLRVVIEAPELGEHGIEGELAGMAEGAVAQVVGQRHGLRQVLVEPQRARGGPGDLGDLQRMGQPGAEVIALVIDEHLGLILEPPERGAVHDPVAIALEGAAQAAGGLGMAPAATVLGWQA